MRLALSSAAAPGASLEELLDAAVRRGLAAVELVEGHGHGLEPGSGPEAEAAAADAARSAARRGVAIAGFRLAAAPSDPFDPGLAAFAEALDAPLLVPQGGDAHGLAGPDGALVVLPDTDPLAALDALPAEVPVTWTADPGLEGLAETGTALVRAAGPRLRHILLLGGGPEATEQEGRGVGSLMARLAVSGYSGTVALAPSSARYRVIWDAWLGRRGGWGCGSRSEDRTLVSLGGAA